MDAKEGGGVGTDEGAGAGGVNGEEQEISSHPLHTGGAGLREKSLLHGQSSELATEGKI